MIGIVMFLIGSALVRPQPDHGAMLIFFRGIQGIGAGSLFPVALSIIGDMFTLPSVAATRACSAPCSASRSWPGRSSADS